jgi:hypothetical protein
MSGLGNLFGGMSLGGGGGGGGGGDSLDSLKYSAPKEPKKSKKVTLASGTSGGGDDDFNFKLPGRTASSNNNTVASPSPAASAPAPAAGKTPGASKVLGSSPVRLYRVNPTTRAYEPVDNGSVLGCVVMGTGINYQLLVYNAQVKAISIYRI